MFGAALVIIGNELLDGYVRDENGPALLARLRMRGIEVQEVSIVPDRVEVIAQTVLRLTRDDGCRWVMTVGGVGPTPDDVTYAGVAQAFGLSLTTSPRIIEWIEQWCPSLNRAEARDAMCRMARVPAGSRLVLPEQLAGPVVALDVRQDADHTDCTIVMLPGDPALVQQVMDDGVESELFAGITTRTSSCDITHNLPEALLVPVFELVRKRGPGVQIGSYPGQPMIIRLTGEEARLCELRQEIMVVVRGLEAQMMGTHRSPPRNSVLGAI